MKVAPEEVEALSSLPEVDHTGLVRVEAETEVTEDGGRPPLGLLGLLPGHTEHHVVVGVADECASALALPGPVEGVQVDVGEEGRDDPSLGSPGDRLGDHPVDQHPCAQPLPQQLEHPSVRHPLLDQREKLLVVDLPERVGDILPTSRNFRSGRRSCGTSTPTRVTRSRSSAACGERDGCSSAWSCLTARNR